MDTIKPNHCHHYRGFTLIEVLIALAIAMVLGAAMAALFSSSVKARQQVERDGQRIEAGRYALGVLGDELRLAGYYGDFQPRSSDGKPWPEESAAAFTWVTQSPCDAATYAAVWDNNNAALKAPVAIQAYEAHDAPVTGHACLTNRLAGTDILVVRRLSTQTHTAGSGTVTTADVYFQASNCATASVDSSLKFKISATQGDLTLHNMNCSTVAKVRKYITRVYYVASCNICAPADGIPTLKVVELGVVGGVLTMTAPESVAQGVENVHYEFGLDVTPDTPPKPVPDGSPDSYALTDISGAGPGGEEWQNVVAVKVFVLVRDLTTTSGYTNAKSYVLGEKTVSAFNDDRKRAVFSTTVRLVNPAGAREL